MITIRPITVRKDLLLMTDPNAPAPNPRRMKHTDMPATKRTLLRNTRNFLLEVPSSPAVLPEENRDMYTGRRGMMQGEKKEKSPAASTVPK